MKVKNLLILVDIPGKLERLLFYGLPLAHQLNARLWVQYAYDIPPELVGEVYISKDTLVKYETVVQDTFTSIEKKLHLSQRKSPGLNALQIVISVGNLVNKMNHLIDQENIDLVLMGNRSGEGWLNHLFENTTLEVIQHAHCPVLSIPDAVAFQPFQRIALTTDLQQIDANALSWFLDFVSAFQAKTDVIHIGDSPEDVTTMKALLERPLGAVDHQFFTILSKDIEKGIEQHVWQYQNDLVVLIPRDHPFFDRLFQKSVTRKVASRVKVPLLTIHASHIK